MNWGASPAELAERFLGIARNWMADGPAERAERARRKLLDAIARAQPATLNEIAAAVGKGAPAVSRSVDVLVRAGLIERTQDPDNRRRLALRLTKAGEEELAARPFVQSAFSSKLDRLATSELRAVERAIEILER
jgi:DNA-binding MarR family transcriptional regulator